jgi:hypothetical protein
MIIAFMGAALYAGFAGREIYPFSSFPMYSTVRAAFYRPEHHYIVGVKADGRVTDDVVGPLGTAVLLQWTRNAQDDPKRLERLGDMLLTYNRRRRPELELVAIRVMRATYEIPPYPRRDRPTKSHVQVIHETRH